MICLIPLCLNKRCLIGAASFDLRLQYVLETNLCRNEEAESGLLLQIIDLSDFHIYLIFQYAYELIACNVTVPDIRDEFIGLLGATAASTNTI